MLGEPLFLRHEELLVEFGRIIMVNDVATIA